MTDQLAPGIQSLIELSKGHPLAVKALRELRDKITELRELCRHSYADGSYVIQIDFGDLHNRRIVHPSDKGSMAEIVEYMMLEIDREEKGAL